MAFKPITVKETIDGVKYTAQFNGVSTMHAAMKYAGDDTEKMARFLFDNVIVEPKISDMDEYFGVKVKHMTKVIEFASAVMQADEKYFPENTEKKDKATD